MKTLRILFSAILLMSSHVLFAQQDTSVPYLKSPNLPAFSLVKVPDSTVFEIAEKQSSKSTLLIVFNTECELCQYEINEIRENISLFKNTRIILASPQDFVTLKAFYKSFGIAAIPGIVMGRDNGYKTGAYFRVRSYPSMFLYDKEGKFVKRFNGSETIKEIAGAL